MESGISKLKKTRLGLKVAITSCTAVMLGMSAPQLHRYLMHTPFFLLICFFAARVYVTVHVSLFGELFSEEFGGASNRSNF